MPLPFALNHINTWLLADGDGYAAVDTGFAQEPIKQPGSRRWRDGA
jgi:hypothetical protein